MPKKKRKGKGLSTNKNFSYRKRKKEDPKENEFNSASAKKIYGKCLNLRLLVTLFFLFITNDDKPVDWGPFSK